MIKSDGIMIVIPAYQPDDKLINTINGLRDSGFSRFVIVNDGSGEKYEHIFEQVRAITECTLLVHEKNRGKGAALKTAFAHIMDNCADIDGVVTCDADGQHLAKDISACAEAMQQRNEIILGCRDFRAAKIPARSRFGNTATSLVFRLFIGMKLSDTQTGLRAIPYRFLSDIIRADGDRFEYETSMLFMIKRMSMPYSEVKIETVYIEENRSSHFRPIRDSVRIYGLLIKYILSSLASCLTDMFVFWLLSEILVPLIPESMLSVGAATVGARVISSLVNYFINVKVVFRGKAGGKTLLRYYALAVPILIASALSVYLVSDLLLGGHQPLLSTVIKMVVDTVLFLVSFRVQHSWVFKEKAD